MPREVQPIAAVQAPAVINIYRIFLIALCNVTCLRASRVVVSLLAYSLFLGAATYLLFPFFTDVKLLIVSRNPGTSPDRPCGERA